MLYKLEEVTFGYESNKFLFNRLSMDIREDEIILLTGPNGSGKTTFCRLLAGLINTYQGSIIFGNKELKNWQTSRIAEKVLYLKQEGNLNVVAATADDDLKIRQLKFIKKEDAAACKNREDVLQQINLLTQQHTPTWELSSGQVNRIGIASLPLFPSHYWILDEPYLGLDHDSIFQVNHWLIERRKQGLGAFIINHIENIDSAIYHHHYHLENGKMIQV